MEKDASVYFYQKIDLKVSLAYNFNFSLFYGPLDMFIF